MDTFFGFFDGLAQQGLSAILEAALMGLLAGAAALFARSWVRRGKVWVKGEEGHTCMSPLILLVGLLCAAMAAACLVLGLLDPELSSRARPAHCLGRARRWLFAGLPAHPAVLAPRLGLGPGEPHLARRVALGLDAVAGHRPRRQEVGWAVVRGGRTRQENILVALHPRARGVARGDRKAAAGYHTSRSLMLMGALEEFAA